MSYTYFLGGGSAVDFGPVAAPEPDANQLVERKACEGGCGGWFYRRLPKTAREGEKLCPGCRNKTFEEQAVEAGESWRKKGAGRSRKAA